MNINKKITISLVLISTILSCSLFNPVNEVYLTETKESISEIKMSDKKGATISFKLSTTNYNKSEFSTKANVNGTPPKTVADIDHYVVYLVKNASTTGYPAGGDPLGTTDLVAGPFTIANTGNPASKTVRFTNIQPVTGAYYIAVKAQDSGNADLIKDNNASVTPWTTTTALTPKVAVSTGNGVTVNSSYVVSANIPSIIPVLLNSVGARIDANITNISGTTDTLSVNTTQNFITTIAGTGSSSYSGDGGLATSAQLSGPFGVALDSSNNVYIADFNNHRIRKITASTGIITTIAGTGTFGATGDGGLATSAKLGGPFGVSIDSSGNVYIADYNNHKIRKITASTGIITTIAGTGTNGSTGDGGLATSAQLKFPNGIAIESSGNVYIADTNNHKIRKITLSTGIITTIAGDGTNGATGDGGLASSAQLSGPSGVALDSSNNVYISDTNNHKIRKITASTGIITTIAGTGTVGATGDGGLATSATLNSPHGIAVDLSGNIYTADYDNYKIMKITASTGIITTIAGTGTAGLTGDGGLSTLALLATPRGIAVDSSGNVYIADTNIYKIRKIYKN